MDAPDQNASDGLDSSAEAPDLALATCQAYMVVKSGTPLIFPAKDAEQILLTTEMVNTIIENDR